mgnify:FL=1
MNMMMKGNEMQKIVINVCFGGFGLSKKALTLYNELTGSARKYDSGIPRDCNTLVQIVEEMGKQSWDNYSQLKVVEIPDGVEWEIKEYDGSEHIAEKHRTWC